MLVLLLFDIANASVRVIDNVIGIVIVVVIVVGVDLVAVSVSDVVLRWLLLLFCCWYCV